MTEYAPKRRPRAISIGKDIEEHSPADEVDGRRHRRRHRSIHIPRESSLSRTASPASVESPRNFDYDGSRRRRPRRGSVSQRSRSQEQDNERGPERALRRLEGVDYSQASSPRSLQDSTYSARRGRTDLYDPRDNDADWSWQPDRSNRSSYQRSPVYGSGTMSPSDFISPRAMSRNSSPLPRSAAEQRHRRSCGNSTSATSTSDLESDADRRRRHRRSTGDDLMMKQEHQKRMKERDLESVDRRPRR